MDDDNEDMTPDELVAILAAALDNAEEEEVVQPTPWSNLDSSAVVFMFGANLSLAASDLFRQMALLALGQSAQDFEIADTKAMSDSVMKSLGLMPETKED